MVTFDDNEPKQGFWTKLKNLFSKKPKTKPDFVFKTSFEDLDIEKCKTDLSNIVKDPDEFTKYEPLTDITKMALAREEFIMKKYHLIGSHNATISHLNDNINFYKGMIKNIVKRKSYLKEISAYINSVSPGDNPAQQRCSDLLKCLMQDEKAYKGYISKMQAKIHSRSIFIGDLTRAKNMGEIIAAEKQYKERTKQKTNKEK